MFQTKIEGAEPIHSSWCVCPGCDASAFRRERRIVRAQATALILAAVSFICLLAGCAAGIAAAFGLGR